MNSRSNMVQKILDKNSSLTELDDFLSQELKVSAKSIDSLVLGGHGDTMVPMPNLTKVNGKPLSEFVKKENCSLL